MRIAIIGTGISGLTCAHLLHPHHALTVFEADGRIGGHTNTVTVADQQGRSWPVDTGFIVCNRRTYPNFTAMLDRLGVALKPTERRPGVHLCARHRHQRRGCGRGRRHHTRYRLRQRPVAIWLGANPVDTRFRTALLGST